MDRPLKILMIEDFEEDANLIKFQLLNDGINFDAKIVKTKEDYIKALESFIPDAILCDHTLPQFDSVRALKLLKKTKRNIPFILVTGSVSEEFAVQMIHAGAHDYIIKDRLTRLPSALLNAIQKCRSENERIKYFNEVLANEALFKKAEKVAHFGIWEADLVKNVTKWSDESFRIMGYDVGEVIPSEESFMKNIHPDDKERIREIVRKAPLCTDTVKMEYRIVDKDGSIRHVESEFLVECDESGNGLKITGFDKDVTGQKIIEIEKKRIAEDYKQVYNKLFFHLENTPLGFIEWDNDLKVLSWSKRSEEIFGWTEAEFIKLQKDGYSQVYPEDLPMASEVARQLLSGEIMRNTLHHRNLTKDGKVIWCDWFNSVQKDKDGKVVSIMSLVQDVTSRKHSEENLIKSEQKFRRFFETAPEAIFILDINENRLVDFNNNAMERFKYSREELLKVSPFDLSPEIQPDGKTTVEKMSNIINRTIKGEELTVEWLIKDSAGKEFYVEVRPRIFTEANQLRVSLIDITERKNAENEKARITNDLFKRNTDLEQFTYIVSHNLRAPVANIIGFMEELKRQDISNEDRIICRNLLSEQINKLDDVVKDMNNILHISTTMAANREKIVFADKVLFIKNGFLDHVPDIDLKITMDFSSAPDMISIKSYMHSIFYNIISNSIKFSQPGKKTEIKISSYNENGKLFLKFSDNGMGIDLVKNADQIFGLYKRFHRNIDGKGIGLFMVKEQVKALGGNIFIESEINKGTTITIEFNI